jgi:hypothetical protein
MMLLYADQLEGMNNRALYADIAEWVAKYRAYAVMGRAYVDMEIACAEGKPLSELLPLLGTYKTAEDSIRGNARLVSPGVLTPFLETLPTRINQICGFDSTGVATLPALTSSLPIYANYTPDLACDGLDETFFWAGRNGLAGDTIQLDLGAAVRVNRVIFNSRNAVGEADYVHDGELSYSVDGQNWIPLGDVNQPTHTFEANVTARYFRVTVKSDQATWVTVSEFSADMEDIVPENLALDEYFVSRHHLIALRDNRIFTALDTDGTAAEGHSLFVTVGESGTVSVLSYALPENGVQAVIRDGNGNEIGRVNMDYETVITAPAGSVAEIPLGHGLKIAEIP